MSASNSSLRPRQRTFTSCTECRRRKQRCNQAKDMCSNCRRRWPPVVCTYSEGSSPPPSFDSVIDLQDDHMAQPVLGSSGGSHQSYVQISQSNFNGYPATTMASNYYSAPPSGYYIPTATARPDYGGTYQGESSNSSSRNQYSSVTNTGSYAVADAGYYQSSQPDYSSAGTQGGYYPTSNYYTSNGDPTAFVGANPAEYYCVEPDHDDVPVSRS
ncbi:uncharacterized protein LY89DRAFT_685757 [Mollisia scopiformis]|uniref:Zn(2)-C6 fungal-type domain-containing protein n=1 Tax=Mollisia scopiformis TaxID=149040 RepID=A0A194X7Q2_MOLSC|nr:uncharacterized protein LY89DRAFT_685757 [Mollisia scopiformis]KUJ15832.1 hypothetical protein LY89DRAFT_685757 [Mollisia scopiformis]